MSRRRSAPDARRGRTKTTFCRCGHPTRDGAYICEDCLDAFAADLRELLPSVRFVSTTRRAFGDVDGQLVPVEWVERIPVVSDPGLWATLRSVIVGERGIDYRALGGSSGSDSSEKGLIETGIELDEKAVQRAADLTKVLQRLTVAANRAKLDHTAPDGWRPRHHDPVPAMAEWLSWRVTAMAFHPDFASAPQDLQRAVDHARWTVMPQPRRQWLGDCLVDGCDGALRARRDETYAICTRCGAHFEAKVLRGWLVSALEDELCTAAEIATLYSPDPIERRRVRKRINQWASRGRLLGWPRVCDWTAGVCPWPAPDPGRNATGAGDLVFRVGEAFDLLGEPEHDDDTSTHPARSNA